MSVTLLCLISSFHFRVRFCEAIINGVDARRGEFPFVVSLRNESGLHFCGGALLSTRKHVLTSAHCLFTDTSMIYAEIEEPYRPESISVLVGTIISDNKNEGELYGVQKLIQHPDYDVLNPASLLYDIGVVVLKARVNLPTVSSIELFEGTLTSGMTAIQVGWGVSMRELVDSWTTTSVLQKLKNKVVNSTECLETLRKITEPDLVAMARNVESQVTSSSVICTLNDHYSGSSYRDSGGPVIVDGKVAAVTVSCIPWARNYPDFSTPVKNYLDFVKAATDE